MREEIFFPRVISGGPASVPDALGGGELVLDDRGCLRMLPGKEIQSGWVPIWPSYFEVDADGPSVRIVDQRKSRVVAEVGKEMVTGGGDIGKTALRENGLLDEQTWRELFERCPPGYSYFLVGEGTRIYRRE